MRINNLKLTHPQKRVWYSQMLTNQPEIWNSGGLLKINKKLNFQLLEKTINIVIKKNVGLRLRFKNIDDEVRQCVKRYEYEKYEHYFFNKESDLISWAEDDFCKGFNSLDDKLYRIALINLNDKITYGYFKFHHIVADGWSYNILAQQIADIYNKLINNEEINEEIEYSYLDYVDIEQEYLTSKRFVKDKEYWLNRFNKLPENILGYNVDENFKGKRCNFQLSEKISLAIKQTCEHKKISYNTFFLSVLLTYLYKVYGVKGLSVGLPVLNRSSKAVKRMIGMFVSTIPFRYDFDDSMTIKELFSDVNKKVMRDFVHQKYPYDLLAVDLKLAQKNIKSLFQIVFTYLNYKGANIFVDDAEIEFLELYSGYQGQPLVVKIKEWSSDGSITIVIDYNLNLFNDDDVNLMCNRLNILLEKFIEANDNEELKLLDIDLLNKEEEKRILFDFNDTSVYYSSDKVIQEVFEEQVKATPQKIAIVCKDQKITYQELNEKANILARALREKGVSRDVIVGVIAEKSIDTVISILGVLKAGSAYLPIDPEYPKKRIAYMLEDSKVDILVTSNRSIEDINLPIEIINIKEICSDNKDLSNLKIVNKPTDLAYIIYTSGSTGVPKGVMLEHKGVLNIKESYKEVFQINDKDKIIQFASFSFDASVEEIFKTLLNSAELHIIDKSTINDYDKFESYIEEKQITIATLPPTYVVNLNLDKLKRLKYLATAGSKINVDLFNRLKDNKIKYVNAYGPTEATICAAVWKYTIDQEINDLIPIGKPINNTKIYIVDKNNKLQPIGVAGELCISGVGLARGYINNQEKTEEKFIDNPFEMETKLYKTGDLARWLPDGNIEFLGRIDNQVKIRGYRIELKEIESKLLEFEEIKEAVVLAKEDRENNKYLCAYIVVKEELITHEIRQQLLKELPGYMMPSYYVQLEKMPLTPTGKIDRKSLIILDENMSTGVEYVPPTNETEEKLTRIWKNALEIERVGINDNFFELGGNSLNAIGIVSNLSMNYEININDIFEYPTISMLGKRLNIKVDNIKNKISKIKDVFNDFDTEKFTPQYFQEEVNLYRDRNIIFCKNDFIEQIKYTNILLIGATGYLGINLLYEILNTSNDCTVFAMMRDEGEHIAKKRLENKMAFYFGENIYEAFKDRIVIINGDLTKDKFGLSEKEYYDLSKKIDCIVNAAANVKHYGIYKDFYEVNVAGTQKLLDFALVGIPKDLKHISTMSVASGKIENKDAVIFTEYDYDLGQDIENFYAKTKFLAEKLVIDARKKGVNTSIFRMGNLVFNSATGKFQENINDNAFYTLIKSLVKIDAVPCLELKLFDFSFIDNVSKAFVLLYDKREAVNEIFHIYNPNTVSITEIGEYINQTGFNFDIKKMQVPKF